MTKNPFVNALCASIYIVLVASIMYYGPRLGPKDTIIVPIAVLSLFTLSAAVMGYVFLYHPLHLYIDGKKKEAVTLFLNTLGVFACITAFIFFILFLLF